MARILSIHAGKTKTYSEQDKSFETAIRKQELVGPVTLTSQGVEGNEVANHNNAVFAYCANTYTYFRLPGISSPLPESLSMKPLRAYRLLLTVLSMLFCFNVYAGEWITDATNGCQAWNGKPASGESITWRGACPGNRASGNGILQWFRNGTPMERNEGEFLDGRMHGKGVSASPNLPTYSGDFENGHIHGKGVFKFVPGDTRESVSGEFRDDKLLSGTTIWANGDRYEGEYREWKQHGKGVLTKPSGYRYEGDWVAGKMTGVGTMKAANGQLYRGGFANDKRNGKGVDTFPDGSMYVGDYKDDQKQGKGRYTWADGKFMEGDWVADRQQGEGVKFFADGGRYTGTFLAGEPSGRGVYVEKSGAHYEGQWFNGKRQGEGMQTWADGDTYAGRWENGLKTGKSVGE